MIFDSYIFQYFNDKYLDEMAEVIKSFEESREKLEGKND